MKVKGVKCVIQLMLEIRLEVRCLGEFFILITTLIYGTPCVQKLFSVLYLKS